MKAIIFDFDGVIVLSEPARFKALQTVAARYGMTIEDFMLAKIVGRTTRDFFALNYPDLHHDIYQQILHDYKREYKDKIIDHVIPIAFTNAFIQDYRGDKLLAVASGSDTKILETMLTHLGIYQKFTRIIGKEHVTKHKPDPEVYIYAASELKVMPAECVVFEDSVVGAQAAIQAGMKVYVLLNGVNSKADFAGTPVEGFVSNLPELHAVLED